MTNTPEIDLTIARGIKILSNIEDTAMVKPSIPSSINVGIKNIHIPIMRISTPAIFEISVFVISFSFESSLH
jgi:hypothetical protein